MKYNKLIALDLDGTLFNNKSQITEQNLSAIRRAADAGIHVVISTGRPFSGLPFEQLNGSGVDYAITANGSAIYRISTKECLCNEGMDRESILPILDFILSRDVHMVAFIDGKGYVPVKCRQAGEKLPLPKELKSYVTDSRIPVENLPLYIQENDLTVQKITLNFYRDTDGTPVGREEIRKFLAGIPSISCVSGGYNNLEFTRADISKGTALAALSELLHVDIADTIAIGDTENDISILKAAGTGVAMGNATPDVQAIADYVTLTNEQDGVAAAIRHFFPELFG